MTRRRRIIVLNSALAAVVLAACGGTYLLVSSSASGATAASVRTVPVRTADVSATVSATGTLASVSQVAANFGTSGTVTSVAVAVGSSVTKGQVLARLDRSDATTQVALAQASLTSARAGLTKAADGTTTTDPKTGAQTTTVDAAQVAQARAQVAQAKATLADAEKARTATVLVAPITGTVLSVNGLVGSTVSAGSGAGSGSSNGTSTDFVTIANLKAMQVSVSFSESDIGSVKVGQAAAVTFPAVSGVTAAGKVVSIDPNSTVTNSVVTYGAVVRLNAVPAGVRLGQTADVTITTATATGALVVPTLAITKAGDRSFVTVVTTGAARRTPIETGVAGTSFTQVTSGLTEGELVQLDLSTTTTTSGTTRTGTGTGGAGGTTFGGPPPGAP